MNRTLRPLLVLSAAMFFCAAPQEPATPNVVPAPPAREPADIAAFIDDAARVLKETPAGASDVLRDTRLLPAHEFPRFRELIRAHAPTGRVAISGADEPGTRLVAKCRVVAPDGAPVPGVLVYAYHTDAKGWYSHRGPHVGGGGDVRHARLFAYVRTDADGRFELQTIRPAGYPRSDLPQHIHLHFEAEGFRPLVSEILFDDDPRLSREQRELPGGYPVCKVEKQADGSDHVAADFTLKSR